MVIYTVYPYVVPDAFFKELEEHHVAHSLEKVHVTLDYNNLPTKYGRESAEHRALKKVAFQLLKEMGEPNPQYEFNYYDVYSPKLRIVIECGNTMASKILENLFRWGNVDEVWTLDYPDANGMSELIKFRLLKT